MPEEAGFPVAHAAGSSAYGFKSFRIETHFHKPVAADRAAKWFDDSGVLLHVSKVPRPHHAGQITYGDGILSLMEESLPQVREEPYCNTCNSTKSCNIITHVPVPRGRAYTSLGHSQDL
eukprot:3616036-Pyramimonas_sp.AAC.1